MNPNTTEGVTQTFTQAQLIPDQPLSTEMRRVRVTDIPERETHASCAPSPSMCVSVERFGVLTPVLLCPATIDAENPLRVGADGKYRLLAGRRRVLAAREVGIMMLNAVIFPSGTTPREAVTLIENEMRSANPLVELQQIEAVIAAGGSLDDVCHATGMDKRRAESRMRLANLTPNLRELLTNNKMAVGVAEHAARLTPEEQEVLYEAAKNSGQRIRGKDVSDARRVKAATASAALPASMFSTDEREPGEAVGTFPASLTVALGGIPTPQTQAAESDGAPAFPLNLTRARAVLFLMQGVTLGKPLSNFRDELTAFLRANDPGALEGEPSPVVEAEPGDPEPAVDPGEVVGASGKVIQAASAARAKRRAVAREAAKLAGATE